MFGPDRLRVAAFRTKGDSEGTPEIEVAAEGGILPNSRGQDYYIVHRIGLESVEIRYVGYEGKNDYETVPLAEN